VGGAACVIIINGNVFGGNVAGAGDAASIVVKDPKPLADIKAWSQLLAGNLKTICELTDTFPDLPALGAVETPGTLAHDICYAAREGTVAWQAIESNIEAVPAGGVLTVEATKQYLSDLSTYRQTFDGLIRRFLQAIHSP
jgi:hypothetical protein